MARNKKAAPISAAWLGTRVELPWGMDTPRKTWNACPSCRCKMLTEAPRLCMACDPTYIQVQPGVYTQRQCLIHRANTTAIPHPTRIGELACGICAEAGITRELVGAN